MRPVRRITLSIACLAAAAVAPRGWAAETTTTDFSAGLGDWAGYGDATWVLQDGTARCTFPKKLEPMQTGLSVNHPCTFTGSYPDGQIALIGFTLRSTGLPPSSTCFELRSGTNYLRCYFFGTGASLDQWRTFVAYVDPLTPAASWRSSVADPAEVLTAVDGISIAFWGGSPNIEQSFDLDNIFICALPRASVQPAGSAPSLATLAPVGGSGGPSFNWYGLIPGLVYNVETAPDPMGPWAYWSSVTAQTTVASTQLPDGTNVVARLLMDAVLAK